MLLLENALARPVHIIEMTSLCLCRMNENMQPQNDEPLQPQNDEPPHPPNDEPHQPQNDEPPHPPNDENLQPRDNEPPHPPNDKPLQPQNDEPPHLPNDEPLHQPNDEPAANQPQPPNPPGIDIDELEQLSRLPKFHQAFSFIQALRAASLDDPVAKLTPEALEKLRNPPQQPPRIASPIIHHGIEMYFHLEHAAQAAYKGIAEFCSKKFSWSGRYPILSWCRTPRRRT
ncbi:hypothetical protein DFJ58DRAFT_736281 [Suillus subalutaceus]|uniref:uncharacterized protein n=1 Tax=Suillus subalutaceus TaxID=48586 RepID=UPI001B8665E7|nr:uncharacterized protein DFJ58DRAFT_736281 [Suillus subalutaceus]KAG1832623.1 hypothetical protein DFJ58DRAFT_736281 [Suillus subalutaceus]